MLMTLFNQEYAMKCYIEEVGQKAYREGELKAARNISLNLATMGFSVEQIASVVKESVTDVKKWLEDGNTVVK